MTNEDSRLDNAYVPTVQELEAERERLGISQNELSRMVGRESGAWNEIVANDIDPQLSTIRAFYEALQTVEADPDADHPEPGRKPRLATGGSQEADD